MRKLTSQQTLSDFFKKLTVQSYTIFPLELILNASDTAQLISFSERNITNKKHQVYVLGHASCPLVGKRGLTIAQRVAKNISIELKRSNADERFEFESFILRTSEREVPPAHDKHIDESTYFTIILPLNSVGPILYLPMGPGRSRKVRVPFGSTVVISGGARAQFKPSITATVHSAPQRKFATRTIAIIIFKKIL